VCEAEKRKQNEKSKGGKRGRRGGGDASALGPPPEKRKGVAICAKQGEEHQGKGEEKRNKHPRSLTGKKKKRILHCDGGEKRDWFKKISKGKSPQRMPEGKGEGEQPSLARRIGERKKRRNGGLSVPRWGKGEDPFPVKGKNGPGKEK